jgi:TRAP-type transport system periplasmic protein
MVLAVPDGCRWKRTKRSGRESAKLYVSSGSTEGPTDPSTPARGRWGDSNRIAPGLAPVLRDESAAVVVKQQYSRERLLIFFIVVIALFALLATHDRANALEQIVIKIATTIPEGTPQATMLLNLKRFLIEETKGWVKVKIFTNGSLGDDKSVIERTRNGTVQMFAGSVDALSPTVPSLNVLRAPYLFNDEDDAALVLNGSIGKLFESNLIEHGLVFGMWTTDGFRSWYTKDNPIRKPQDLKGLRLPLSSPRAAQNELFQLLEIVPVNVEVTEVFSRLQRRELDGFEGSPREALASSWYRFTNHLTLSEYTYQPGIVVYSKRWFDGLPEKIVEALDRIPERLSSDERETVKKLTPYVLNTMQQRGMAIYRPTAKEREVFVSTTDIITKNLAATAGKEGMKIVQAIQRSRETASRGSL